MKKKTFKKILIYIALAALILTTLLPVFGALQ